MAYFAVREDDGTVSNIILCDDLATAEASVEKTCVEYTEEHNARIGGAYDSTTQTFSAPVDNSPAPVVPIPSDPPKQ